MLLLLLSLLLLVIKVMLQSIKSSLQQSRYLCCAIADLSDLLQCLSCLYLSAMLYILLSSATPSLPHGLLHGLASLLRSFDDKISLTRFVSTSNLRGLASTASAPHCLNSWISAGCAWPVTPIRTPVYPFALNAWAA